MSYWVHVTCIVKSPVEINMEEIFGKELPLIDSAEYPSYNLYEDKEKYHDEFNRIMEHDGKAWKEYMEHPDDYLPVGSEGSLKHAQLDKSAFNPDSRYVYAIQGGLRDRFDDYEYVRWFRKKFLDWLNHIDADEHDEVYGRVESSNGAGILIWEYGPSYQD
mgnify:CR=1 FL=1